MEDMVLDQSMEDVVLSQDETSDKEPEKKIGYKDVFTQKEYCKMIVANTISRFGDSIDATAFTWLVYQVTGSAAWSVIIFALNQLPSILVQPFAGVWVEKMNKKKLMVLTDLVRGFVVAALATLYFTGMINPLILVLFTLIISSVEAFRMPAGMAIIPKIIDPDLYSYASSLNSTISSVVQLVGLGCAGVIIGLLGVHTAIFIDAVTFFASALIIMFIRIKEDKNAQKKIAKNTYFSGLKEGFAYLKNRKVVRNFCIMGILVNAIMVPINSLQSPLVSDVLGQGGELLSVFGIALTVGMGLGSLVYPKLAEKVSPRHMVVLGGILTGASVSTYTVGALFNTRTLLIYLFTGVVSLVLGFFVSLITSHLGIQFVKCVEENYLARVGSIFNALTAAAVPVTSFFISIVATKFTTASILLTSGLLCVILFILIEIRKVEFA